MKCKTCGKDFAENPLAHYWSMHREKILESIRRAARKRRGQKKITSFIK